jgi:hypothetical protein
MSDKPHEENSMVNFEKQTTRARKQKSRKQSPSKQDLLISKPLVGDEIQRRNNEMRRGGARVEKLH